MTPTTARPTGARAQQTNYWRVRNGRTPTPPTVHRKRGTSAMATPAASTATSDTNSTRLSTTPRPC